jgi:hypothetical protein
MWDQARALGEKAKTIASQAALNERLVRRASSPRCRPPAATAAHLAAACRTKPRSSPAA